MNRDEIIRMSRKAGWSGLYTTFNEPTGKADWNMVKESLTVPVTIEQIERFADLVAAAEREACAIAGAAAAMAGKDYVGVAAAIRARGNV